MCCSSAQLAAHLPTAPVAHLGFIFSEAKVASQLYKKSAAQKPIFKRTLCIAGRVSKVEGSIHQHGYHGYKLQSLSSTHRVWNVGEGQRAPWDVTVSACSPQQRLSPELFCSAWPHLPDIFGTVHHV